ncbi:MAG TPA: metallophosphoesterase, partial [Gammaproteobacteria bacterium]|nr:metallophosphoesterase [Gammaproteobacteria bacterium]
MSTYVIGDIHGCFDQLQELLAAIKFNPRKDILWFTGDLINGGPKPVEVLRFIRDLGDKQVCVLGNHDLVLLAIANGKVTPHNDRKIGFEPVFEAPDCDELITWLRMRPMVHF